MPPKQVEDSAKLQRAYHSTHNIYTDTDTSNHHIHGTENLNKSFSATSLANDHFADRQIPVRHVPVGGESGNAQRAVHHRIHEMRGGRSKEREKTHFKDILDKDYYVRDSSVTDHYTVKESSHQYAAERRNRPSDRHAHKYERVQSAEERNNTHFKEALDKDYCARDSSATDRYVVKDNSNPYAERRNRPAERHTQKYERVQSAEEREKTHFRDMVERDYYVRDSPAVDHYVAKDTANHYVVRGEERRNRPAERHVQKYERVQSAPNYTTSQHFESSHQEQQVRTVPIQEQRVYATPPPANFRPANSRQDVGSPQPPERRTRRLLPDVEGRARVHRSESTKK